MTTVLDIARDCADDLSVVVLDTLFPSVEEGDTTARRLRRAMEKTLKHLAGMHDWQQSRRAHEFLTVAGTVQTRAVPADLLRFVQGSFYDRSIGCPVPMAATDAQWTRHKALAVSAVSPIWIRAGNDIHIGPNYPAGRRLGFDYVSDAIVEEPAVAHAVLPAPQGSPLAPMARYVVRRGQPVLLPVLGQSQSVELVIEAGNWLNSQVTFDTPDGSPIVNECPADYADWISVTKHGAQYVFRPLFGYWPEIAIRTINGMTLESGRRYAIGKGHIVYVPVLAIGEQIEVLPVEGRWVSSQARIVTRDGTDLGIPLNASGVATITSDMAMTPAYTVGGTVSQINPVGRARRKSRITTDRDVPLWDHELVTLGTVWNFTDGLPYTEGYRSFQRRIYDALKGSQGYGLVDMGAVGGRSSSDRANRTVAVLLDAEPTWQGWQP